MRNLIAQFAQDLRFAGRHIAKTKTTTLTMVAVLSFGVVVNAALFGVVHAVTSRPAPGITPDDALVRVRSARLFSYPELSELAAQRQAFDAVAGFATEPLPIDAASLGGKAEGPLSNVFFVTHDYFRVLGLQVTGGAGLPTDSAVNRFANPVAVISHAMWTDELGGRADVVGRSIRVNDVPTTIVGVAPPRFIGVDGGRQTRAVWMPVGAARAVANWGDPTISYDSLRFNVVARLRADASMASATPLATSIVKQADTRLTRPRGPAGLRPPQIVPLRALNNGSGADAKFLKDARPLTVLTVLVLLITCANVASLLTAAGVARRREIAVRLSMGAERPRVVRQLLTEGLLVAGLASALSLAMLWAGARIAGNRIPNVDLTPDAWAVAFAAGIAVVITLLFSLAPALHATRISVAEALKNSGGDARARARLQNTFVAAQVGLSQPLLLIVAMHAWFFLTAAASMRPSPVADRVLNVRLERGSDKRLSTKRVDEAVDNVVAGLLRAPGVRDVIRMQDAHLLETRLTAGDPERQVTPPPERAMAIRVPAGYLRVMGIPIVAGRDINTDDIALRRRVVVVGSGFARTVWGTSNPLGKQLWTTSHTSGRSYEVIGVFDGSDGRDDGRRGSFAEHRYELDAFQEEWRAYANGDSNTGDALLVRTTGPGASAGPMIRAVVRQAAPELVVSRMNTLLELHESEFSNMMRGMTLAGIGGAAMLLLACAGLYAVIAFGVASREREIGVRIALGARPREVVSLFLRRGLRLTVVGIVVGVVPGIVIAPAVTRGYVERALGAGPVPGFAVVIGFVALLLIVVSAVAILIPARRAATVDPLVALRAE